jgi:flagellar biosynthetic protein FlhB
MYSYLKDNLELNLQLFAADSGEKTEKATPRKKQEARKKGQVLQSREITTALALLFVFVTLKITGSYIYGELKIFTEKILSEYLAAVDKFSFEYLTKLFIETLTVLMKTTVPILAVALITGLCINYAQVGFLFTTENLAPKLERINPLSGLKRMFSFRSVVELVKSIAKIFIVGYVAYSYLNGETQTILGMMGMDTMSIAVNIANLSVNVAIRICVVLLLLAFLDYGYQWWEYEKNLRMTKQEVKEEYKQSEGNPEIKSKIRQKQRQMSMRRMLQEVPKADVVITNPTHYAIALKYDVLQSDAPVVLAKGQDYLALRIKDIARENKVEIVENRALARSIYESVDIGEKIPPELYQAVAEVLAFVYGLKGKR